MDRPMTFFTELATNATKHNVAIVTYVGNDDGISGHFGTQGQPFPPALKYQPGVHQSSLG